jgi:hypothetical protein
MKPAADWMATHRIDLWLWVIHYLSSCLALAGLPFSKFFHLVATPINLMVNAAGPVAASPPVLRSTRRALGLDAWVEPISDPVLEGLSNPLMFIQADQWGADNEVDLNSRRAGAIYEAGQSESYLLVVAGAAHYDFTDLPLFSPITAQLGLSSDIPSKYMAKMLNHYTLAFFNQYLREETGGLSTKTPRIYPEVTINFHP